MRIRTIKPEFWTHPVMVRQSDATKLLAIGLLNYSDDFGYFYATPAMVRAALRPLDEDSTNVRASLEELSKIGFLEMSEHPTHGKLGRIVSFTDHQKVDRPSASKIKGLWDSTNARRMLDDQSSLDQGNRDQGNGVVHATEIAPPRKETRTHTVRGRSAHTDDEPPELMTEAQAIAVAMNQQVPHDFARMVFGKWNAREHRDGAGIKVLWTPHVTDRWRNEGPSWKAGQHRSQTANGSAPKADPLKGIKIVTPQ